MFFVTNYFSDRISKEKVLCPVTFRLREFHRKNFPARKFSSMRTLRSHLLCCIVEARGVNGGVRAVYI